MKRKVTTALPELKGYDNQGDTTGVKYYNAVPYVFNKLYLGFTQGNRIGDKVLIHSIRIKGHLTFNATNADEAGLTRITVLWFDGDEYSVAATMGDIIEGVTDNVIDGSVKLKHTDQYRILADRYFTFLPGDGKNQEKPFDIFIKIDRESHYYTATSPYDSIRKGCILIDPRS